MQYIQYVKMELANFIKINQISDYNILKKILESDPYNLKVKEDNNYPSIFLIHTKENSNVNLKIVNECNGIVLDKDTLKIICYTFDKCSDMNAVPDNFDKKNLYLEYALEGTLIRLYYHNEWILSTKKCFACPTTFRLYIIILIYIFVYILIALNDKNILNQLNSTTMNVIINNSITSEADLENPPYSEFVVRNFSYYKL